MQNPSATPLGMFSMPHQQPAFFASGMGKGASDTSSMFHALGASPPTNTLPESAAPSLIGVTSATATAATDQPANDQQQQQQTGQEDEDDSDASGGEQIQDTESVSWGLVFQWLVLLTHLGYCFYYFGVVWLWTPFQYEYTQMWNTPSPGPFIDQTTNTWMYFVISWMIIQFFPVPALVYSMVRPESYFR